MESALNIAFASIINWQLGLFRKFTVEVPRDREGLTSILIKNSIISKNFTNNLLVDNKTGV